MRAEGVLGMILPKDRDPRFVTIRRGGTLTDSDHQLLALWAALCAEHVLDLFESARPLDPRPRRAIEHARAWARGEVTMTQARSAGGHAMAAGRRLRGAARHAAYAAGQAAVVAHVAAHELGAAAYAIKAARSAALEGEGESGARARSRGRASRATIHPVLNQTEPVEANEMASPPGAGCSPFEHACDLTLVQRCPVQV